MINKPKKNGLKARLGKTFLASALAVSLVLGAFPAAPAQAADSYGYDAQSDMVSGKIGIHLASLEGPAIRMDAYEGENNIGKYNFGQTSNTFRMIQGQAIEKNQNDRPKEPKNPETEPGWADLSEAEKNAKKEQYQRDHETWKAKMDAYWKNIDTWKPVTSTLNPTELVGGSVDGFTLWQKPGNPNLKTFWLFDKGEPDGTNKPVVTKNAKDFTITGKVQGNKNLDLELTYETLDREAPNPTDIVGDPVMKEDRATYLLKVTNTSKTEAQVFGTSWNVDTWIINNDNAPFRGPGLNTFTTDKIDVGFPTKWADQFTGDQWTTEANKIQMSVPIGGTNVTVKGLFPDNVNSYKDRVPEFLYATASTAADAKTAIIYPKAQGSRKYPEVSQDQAAEKHFENPDYFGIGWYGNIASTSTTEDGTNYWWHVVSKDHTGSSDSGHIVRYNPRVILPGETKYFGVTYGEADVDQRNPNGPYLLTNNPTTAVNVDDQNKYSPVTLDLLYGNTSAQPLTDAAIKMYLPVNYFVAEDSMTNSGQPAQQWKKEPGDPVKKYINGKMVDCNIWTRTLGTVPAQQADKSVNNVVILDAVEQTGSRNDGQKLKPDATHPTSVTPVYAFELEYKIGGSDLVVPDHAKTDNTPAGKPYKDEYKYTHKNIPVKLPFVNPVNLSADIWRDYNGDGIKDLGDGISGTEAKIDPLDEGRKNATSVYGGFFKFIPQGYGKDRTKTYKVTFSKPNATNADKEKYIWKLDDAYDGSNLPNKQQVPDKKVFYSYPNPNISALDTVIEQLGTGVDDEDNPVFNFKVKEGSADVINLDLRIKESLAGKLKVKPFLDKGANNHQYEEGSDILLPDGKYRLASLKPDDTSKSWETKYKTGTNPPDDAWGVLDKDRVKDNEHKVVAFENYQAQYAVPEGFRSALTGAKTATAIQRNVDSVIRTPAGTTMPLELLARDLRFAGKTGSSEINVVSEAGEKEVDNTKYVELTTPATTTDSEEKTLVFNAWKDYEEEASGEVKPKYLGKDIGKDKDNADRASLVKWEVLSDPSNILKNGEVTSKGTYVLKADAVGTAKVRVSFKDYPNINDDIYITIKNDAGLAANEKIEKLTVADVTVDRDTVSSPLELNARIVNKDTNAFIKNEVILPAQLDEFKPADETAFLIDTRDTNRLNKKFKVKGLKVGNDYTYTAKYDGQVIPVEGKVHVKADPNISNNYQATISPNPVKVKVGETKTMTYLLKGLNGANDKPLTATGVSPSVNPTIANSTVADFDGDKSKVKGKAVGTTTISYDLGGGLTASADIVVYDENNPGAAADGQLTFIEVTDPKTNGIIPVGGKAKYKAFFDKNGNGQPDADEPFVTTNDTSASMSDATKATVASAGSNVFEVTGAAPGQADLKLTYNKDGKLYTGTFPINVTAAGTSVQGIELSTNKVIVKKGATNSDTLKVKAKLSDNSTVDLSRPTYTVTGLDGSGAKAVETGDKTGPTIRVEGKTVGVQEFTVKYAGKEATGKVIVIPTDTTLELDPLFVKKGDTVAKPKAKVVSGDPALTDAMKAEITQEVSSNDLTLLKDEPSDPTKFKAENTVGGGADKISAKIPGTDVEAKAPAYVYEEGQIKVDKVEMQVGDEKPAGVHLKHSLSAATDVVVPAKLLKFKLEDPSKAEYKNNTMEAADSDGYSKAKGDAVFLKGKAVGTTKLKVKLGSAEAEGDVVVNPGSTGVSVSPDAITLYKGDTVGKEITVRDRATNQPLPLSELTFEVVQKGTTTNDMTNTVEKTADGKILVKRSNDPASPNTPETTVIVKHNGTKVGEVQVTNSPIDASQEVTYTLETPDYAMYLGQADADNPVVQLQNVTLVKKKGTTVDRVPLNTLVSDADKHQKVDFTADYGTLSGSADLEKDNDNTNSNLFKIVPKRAGASQYVVRYQVNTPAGLQNLEAIGKLAIFKDDPNGVTAKFVVTEPKEDPAHPGTFKDVEVEDGAKLKATGRQDVKLKYTYPDGTEQIVSGASLVAFVKEAKSENDKFKVASNGVLKDKTPNSGSTKVIGEVATGITAGNKAPSYANATPSQSFEFDDSTVTPPSVDRSFIVKPKKIVVFVGKKAEITTQIREGSSSTSPINPVTATFTTDNANATVVAQNGKGEVTGVTAGKTNVRVAYAGFVANVEVTVVDDTTGELHVTADPNRPSSQPDPNQPGFTGDFITPGEVVQVPVGGKVPYRVDLNGVPLTVDPTISPEDQTIADANNSTKEIEGKAIGVTKITFKHPDNPNVTKTITAIVTGTADGPGIDVTEERVFRASAPTVDIHATVALGTAPTARVAWVMSGEEIADLDGSGLKIKEEAASNQAAHQMTAHWVGTPEAKSAKLTAIVLESGKRDFAELYGKQVTVSSFNIVSGNPIKLEKDQPTLFDNLANDPSNPLKMKLVDNDGNEYDTSLADFEVLDSTGPLELSGADKRTLKATDVGSKTLKLKHRQTGAEVTLNVVITDENNPTNKVEVKFETPVGGINPPAKAVIEVAVGTILDATHVPNVDNIPSGYEFKGWKNKDTGAMVNPIGQKIDAPTTFVAVVEQPGTTNALTFNAGTGTINGQPSKTINFPKGAKIQKSDLPVVTPPTGYRFKGWSPDPVGTTPTGDMTYTAQFERIIIESTVKFDPGMGTLVGSAEIKVERGTKIKDIEVPTINAPSNYKFTGWSPANPVGYTVNEETITFKANYERIGGSSGGGGGGGGGGGAIVPPTNPSKPTTPDKPTTPTKPGGRIDPVELNKNFKFAYLTGYPDDTVRANAPITRGEVASIFARILAKQMDPSTTYTSKFSDIKAGKWYTNNVAYLESFSILSGYQDGTFKPDNKISRAEFATMINNFAKPANVSSLKHFTDVKPDHWAKANIDNAVALEWMSGYPDGTFGPDKKITRAEVVSVVNKLIERTPDKADLNSKAGRYKDLKDGFWAYYDVLEASTDRSKEAKK